MGELFSGLAAHGNRARSLCADRDGSPSCMDCGCWRPRRKIRRGRYSRAKSLVAQRIDHGYEGSGPMMRAAARRRRFLGRRCARGCAERQTLRGSDQESRLGHRGKTAHLAVSGAQRIPDVAAGRRGADDLVADHQCAAGRAAATRPARRIRRRRRGTSSACRKCWSSSIRGMRAWCCPASSS